MNYQGASNCSCLPSFYYLGSPPKTWCVLFQVRSGLVCVRHAHEHVADLIHTRFDRVFCDMNIYLDFFQIT